MRILVTSGATREPIDGVRFISNFSTGQTGAQLADFFIELGFEVTYLRGEGAAEPSGRCEILGFSDFDALDGALRRELGKGGYFAVVHLAAVSDYSVHSVVMGERSFSPRALAKIDSREAGNELGLVLRRNSKIVDHLKGYGAPGEPAPWVVAFKLTHSPGEKEDGGIEGRRAARRMAAGGAIDAVVHNDLAQIRAAARGGPGGHRFDFFRVRGGEPGEPRRCSGAGELGTAIAEWFAECLSGGNA